MNKDFSFLKNIKLALFDMDGTIYLGNQLFNYSKELIETLVTRGVKVVFVTNNPSKSKKDYVKKLLGMGIKVDEDNFFTSVDASCYLLKQKFNNEKIYVQSTKSCYKQLKESGLNVTNKYDESVKAILVAYDTELTYKKLNITSKLLTKLNVPYYATNPDWVCPTEYGYVPDCGSLCFMYEKATGKTPIYIGKPEPLIIDLAIKKYSFDKSEVILVGDRIYTDIKSGYNAGIKTVLMLCGEAKLADVKASDIKPDYIFDDIKSFYEAIK